MTRRATIRGSRFDKMIGVAATSSAVNFGNMEKSLERFARWKVPTCVADQVHLRHRYLAGSDEARALALDAFLRDPQIGTIWCARGGFGATRLLPFLDAWKAGAQMKRAPKLLVGFSDVTALHFYFYQKAGVPSLHAVMPGTPSFPVIPPRTDKILRSVLAGKMELGKKSFTADWKAKILLAPKREAEGVLMGGNLTLLVNLIGTPWQPDLNGKILFLEDCGEQPYRVDRMLTHMSNAGMLNGLRGVLLGDFESDVIYKEEIEKKYWKEIFTERFEALGIPVLRGLPFGHIKRNDPVPFGVRAAITKTGKVLVLDQVVKA